MSEIKVVPYIPDEDDARPALVGAVAEFWLGTCLFLIGFKNTRLGVDMF